MKGILSTRQDPEGWRVNTADKTRNEGREEPGLCSHNTERLHMEEKTNTGTGITRPEGRQIGSVCSHT